LVSPVAAVRVRQVASRLVWVRFGLAGETCLVLSMSGKAWQRRIILVKAG